MEPRPPEKPVESRGEEQTSPPRPSERKRRFQIIKLEERIAPAKGGNGTNNGCFSGNHCYSGHRCYTYSVE